MADSIEKRIHQAKIAVDNARKNSEIMRRLIVYKYGPERMETGEQSYTVAREFSLKQIAEYGDKHAATAKVKECRAEASIVYYKTFKVAKIAFRDDSGAQTALGLNGRRKQSLAGCLPQARCLFVNILESEHHINKMAYFGYDQEKLESEYALVKALEEAILEQKVETGQAQNATKERDAKVDEMDRWMADFKSIAKIALADKPQLMEELGFGAIK